MPVAKIKNAGSIKASGGWLGAMINELAKKIKVDSLLIISVGPKKDAVYKKGKVTYIHINAKNVMKKYDSSASIKISKVIKDFSPDIIDIQGLEFYIGNLILNISYGIPVVATIQGLSSQIAKKYNSCLPYDVLLKKRTLKDWLLFDGLLERRKGYEKRGKNELSLISKINIFIGRTLWDKQHVLAVNPQAKYFHCNRNLREEFYNVKWDINEIERYTLFTSQAHYPIKGLHILLEAIALLKNEFPKIKLYVAGKDLLRNGLINRLLINSYEKYIQHLIKDYDLNENICFTGWLNAAELKNYLLRSHVFAIPSTIENSPNSLAEAQLVGVPVVASKVGGIPSYVKDYYDGLLYENNDSICLGEKIRELFKSDALCISLSENERNVARVRHDKERNSSKLVDIYSQIIQE